MAQFSLYLGHSATGVAFACAHAAGSGEGGWNAYVGIDRIAAANINKGVKGNKCRISIFLSQFDVGGSVIAHIGKKSPTGDAYDFASTPTQVMWAGSGALPGIGATQQEYVSDWFTLPENFDPTSDYLIAFGLTGTISTRNIAVTGGSSYYKGGAPDPAQVDKTGYAGQADITKFISRIEISGGGPVILGNPAGWDSSIDYDGYITFEDDDKTAVAAPDIGTADIFSVTGHASGKQYVEVTFEGGGVTGVGLVSPSPSSYGPYISKDGDIYIYTSGGNTTHLGVFPPLVEGDVVGMAIDIDAGKVWFRVNGGDWNNDPTQGPV